MSKKTLSLAVLMSMATTGAFAASNTSVPMTTAAVDTALVTTSVNNGTKLSKYQEEAIRMTQAAMANKQANDAGTYPSAISVDAPKTVQLALENNRTAKQSAWDYESKKAAVSETAAGMNPQLSASYSGGKSNKTGSTVTSSSTGFTLDVPVFNAATSANIHGSRYSREGAGAAYEEALQQAKFDAVNGYYTLIKDRNAVDVARQSVTDYDGHLKNVQAQYNVGLVANSDVMSSKTDLADAQTKLVTAQNTADLAETSLNTVLALPVSTKIDTADKSLNYTPYNLTLDQAKSYALVHRAQLVQSAMAVKSAEETLKAAKAGYLPTVGVSAGKGYSSDSWRGFGDGSDWNIGANVKWSAWNGGATEAKIKEAEAAFEKAKEANLATVDKVMSDVQSAYLKLRAAEQTINSTKTAVESAQEAFRIQSLRYRAGVGANIDVLDAETKLTSARNSYLDALYDYNVAVAQLEQYVGIPLETPVGAGAALIASNESANTLAALTQATTTK